MKTNIEEKMAELLMNREEKEKLRFDKISQQLSIDEKSKSLTKIQVLRNIRANDLYSKSLYKLKNVYSSKTEKLFQNEFAKNKEEITNISEILGNKILISKKNSHEIPSRTSKRIKYKPLKLNTEKIVALLEKFK